MKSIRQWKAAIKDYFNSIGRDFDVDNDSDTQKVFCISKNEEGKFVTIPLSEKMQAMASSAFENSENLAVLYDQEMRKLIDSGAIQFLQPGTTDVKILKTKIITDPDFAKLEEINVDDEVFETDAPNHDLGTLRFWWLNIKALFFEDAKQELASYNFFTNNPIKQINLQAEQKALEDKHSNEIAHNLFGKDTNKFTNVAQMNSTPAAALEKLQARLSAFERLDTRVVSYFGKTIDEEVFPLYVKNKAKIDHLPKIDGQILKLKSSEQCVAYLGLCVGIGTYCYDERAVYRIKETTLPLFLDGNIDVRAINDFYDMIKEGRARIAILTDEKNAIERNAIQQNILGFDIRNGIRMLNQMLNTSHPSELVNPNSNCFAVAKIINETMRVLDLNPELAKAAELDSRDKALAKGACALYDILDQSQSAQLNLISDQINDIDFCVKQIATEAKLRGACAINEFTSYGVEKLQKLKEFDTTIELDDKIDQCLEIYPAKAVNTIILTLGTNKNYFSEDLYVTELENNIKSASKDSIPGILLNGIQAEAERYSKKLIKEMKAMPEKKASLHKLENKQINNQINI